MNHEEKGQEGNRSNGEASKDSVMMGEVFMRKHDEEGGYNRLITYQNTDNNAENI